MDAYHMACNHHLFLRWIYFFFSLFLYLYLILIEQFCSKDLFFRTENIHLCEHNDSTKVDFLLLVVFLEYTVRWAIINVVTWIHRDWAVEQRKETHLFELVSSVFYQVVKSHPEIILTKSVLNSNRTSNDFLLITKLSPDSVQ